MFKRRHSRIYTASRIPRFFTLWFVFCAILAVTITGFTGFVIYSVVTDPEIIGVYIAEIMNGYNSAVMPEDPTK